MPPRDTIRLLLAAAVAGLLLWLAPVRWGMSSSFAATLPLIVLCGGWLSRRAPEQGPTALALMLCIPAIGSRMWGISLIEMEAEYIAAYQTHPQMMAMLTELLQPSGFLLLAAALAVAVLGQARLGAAALALGAASILGSTLALQATTEALIDGRYPRAARLAQLIPGLALLPLPLLAFCRRPDGLLCVALLACVASVSLSPIGWMLPQPPPVRADAPHGAPGPLLDLVPLDPTSVGQLNAAGLVMVDADFWCRPSRWDQKLWVTVNLGLNETRPVEVLAEKLPNLLVRGVQQIGIQGQAAPLPGPLGARLSAPTALLVLSPPPEDVGFARLTKDAVEWVRAPVDGQCFVETSPGMTIGGLFRHTQDLTLPGAPCAVRLGLSLHTRPAREDGWRPPADCPAVEFPQQE